MVPPIRSHRAPDRLRGGPDTSSRAGRHAAGDWEAGALRSGPISLLGRSDIVNGKQGDHPVTDIVYHGLSIFSPEIDAKVRDLNELGSLRNTIAGYWLLEADGLLRIAREAGQVEHLGRPMDEAQVLAYVDGVLSIELSRVRRAPG